MGIGQGMSHSCRDEGRWATVSQIVRTAARLRETNLLLPHAGKDYVLRRTRSISDKLTAGPTIVEMAAMGEPIRLSDYRHHMSGVYFNRHELRRLLDVYSRRVMSGEWKDYAIDHQSGRAIFSIFRHSFDLPLFSIAKRRDGKRCAYQVFSGQRKIRQSATIEDALSIFDRKLHAIPTYLNPR